MDYSLETYKTFHHVWMHVVRRYNITPDRVAHLFLGSYEKALQGWDPSRGSFVTYAFFIARGRLRGFLKTADSKQPHMESYLNYLYEYQASEMAQSPEHTLEVKDLLKKVFELAKLSENQMNALNAMVVEGLTCDEFVKKYSRTSTRQAAHELKKEALRKLREGYERLERQNDNL